MKTMINSPILSKILGNKIVTNACLALSAVIGVTAISLPADAADFRFTFNNVANGFGIVEGTIFGLDEGTGSATSVVVTSNTDGFGLGEYIGDPLANSFTVVGNEIITANFTSRGIFNQSGVTDSSLALNLFSNGNTAVGLTPSADSTRTNSGTNLMFTLIEDPDATVPEPSAAIGLITFGLVAIRKRKFDTSGRA